MKKNPYITVENVLKLSGDWIAKIFITGVFAFGSFILVRTLWVEGNWGVWALLSPLLVFLIVLTCLILIGLLFAGWDRFMRYWRDSKFIWELNNKERKENV